MVRSGCGRHAFRGGGAKRPYMARVSLSATGFYKTPKIEWDRIAGRWPGGGGGGGAGGGGGGGRFFYFAYGVACAEVVIDTLTGENRILRTDITA